MAALKMMQTIQKLKYKRVTHCIFDLDGTILDSEPAYQAVILSMLKQFKVPYTKELQMSILGTTSRDLCKRLVEAGVNLSLDECVREFQQEAAVKLRHCKMKPGVQKLIRHLYKNHVPIAIATSSSKDEFDLKMEKLPHIRKLFHHIVTGGSDPGVKNGKPAPDIYLVCAERFRKDIKPEDVLVFEDAPNGVTGARAAGMQVVMIPEPWTVKSKCKAATLVLDTMERFKPELFGLPMFEQCSNRSKCKTSK